MAILATTRDLFSEKLQAALRYSGHNVHYIRNIAEDKLYIKLTRSVITQTGWVTKIEQFTFDGDVPLAEIVKTIMVTLRLSGCLSISHPDA